MQGRGKQKIPHLVPGETELAGDRAGDPRDPEMVTHDLRRHEIER